MSFFSDFFVSSSWIRFRPMGMSELTYLSMIKDGFIFMHCSAGVIMYELWMALQKVWEIKGIDNVLVRCMWLWNFECLFLLICKYDLCLICLSCCRDQHQQKSLRKIHRQTCIWQKHKQKSSGKNHKLDWDQKKIPPKTVSHCPGGRIKTMWNTKLSP